MDLDMLRQRKSPRLTDYDYNSNGVYFLTFCTTNKEKIFGEIVGGDALGAPQMRLSAEGKIVEEHIRSTDRLPYATLLHYVVMPNHVHLLVLIDTTDNNVNSNPQTAAVPSVISAIKRFTNQQIGRNIFQRSYHDHVVRNEADFQRIWEYIDTNPIKWTMDKFYVD